MTFSALAKLAAAVLSLTPLSTHPDPLAEKRKQASHQYQEDITTAASEDLEADILCTGLECGDFLTEIGKNPKEIYEQSGHHCFAIGLPNRIKDVNKIDLRFAANILGRKEPQNQNVPEERINLLTQRIRTGLLYGFSLDEEINSSLGRLETAKTIIEIYDGRLIKHWSDDSSDKLESKLGKILEEFYPKINEYNTDYKTRLHISDALRHAQGYIALEKHMNQNEYFKSHEEEKEQIIQTLSQR